MPEQPSPIAETQRPDLPSSRMRMGNLTSYQDRRRGNLLRSGGRLHDVQARIAIEHVDEPVLYINVVALRRLLPRKGLGNVPADLFRRGWVLDVDDTQAAAEPGAVEPVAFDPLLELVRAEPGEPWTAARLARRLYVDENGAARLLRDLDEAGLLQPSGNGHRFEPVDAALATVVAELDAIYARRVVEVAELIHSSSDRKAQRFADAFRLRKEP